MSVQKVTICACANRRRFAESYVAGFSDALKKNGYEVEVVDDLCRLAMDASPEFVRISETFVLACQPRAVAALFKWHGLAVQQWEQLSGMDSRLNPMLDWVPGNVQPFEKTAAVESENAAWFPILDKNRCVECGRCLDFCLFGVYSKNENRMVVTNPQNCKNNCPACARMCPQRAIIFPKYDKSPINGGLEEEETFSVESMEILYNERLRYRLQERRQGVSLLKKS